MESAGGDQGFRGGGIIWTSTQTGTETINDILKYSSSESYLGRSLNEKTQEVVESCWVSLNSSAGSEIALSFPPKLFSLFLSSCSLIVDLSLGSAQSLRGAKAGPQVEPSSTNTSLLKGSSSSVPYFHAASSHSISSFGSASVATPSSCTRANSGSTSTNGPSSSRVSCSATCSSTSSLKPRSNGSSADLKRIRPSQRHAFLKAAATTESSTSSRASIEEERVSRNYPHSQGNPGVETPMHPIDNLDTLHRMLQSVNRSWSASNASSPITSTGSGACSVVISSKPPSRVVTLVPSTSKALQPKGSRKAPLSSLKNGAAPPLPSRSTPPHTKTVVAGVEAIENPLKEAVAKFESPVRTRPRRSIGNNGNNPMPPPPPPPKPLPYKQRPHLRSTSACDLSVADMSFEVEAPESQIDSPFKPEEKLEQSYKPIENGELNDAEDSYDDLSFVDVDGLMDVDLDERSDSPPAIEQHVPSTTQEPKTVLPPPPVRSSETQKLSVASVMQGSQHSKPVIKRETFFSIFSTPIQVAPSAPSVSAAKALGMRRVHSGPVSGCNTSELSASVSSVKPGTAPPYNHPSTRGPKPFKVPWARNTSSVTAVESSAAPDVRRPAPKRRGVLDLDTSVESSFSFDDMDPEEVEQLLSQIGA